MRTSQGAPAGKVHGVLVTYRRPDGLAEMLARVAEPGSGLSSLVIVDNAPSRASEAVVAHATPVVPIAYVAMAENVGPAGGIAAGMARVLEQADDQDWMLVLDDDNPPHEPDGILQVHAFASALVARGMAVGAVGIAGARLNRWTGTLRTPADHELHGAIDVDYVAGGQLLMASVRAVRRCGVHDARLFFGFDDLDFCLRLKAGGFSVFVDGEQLSSARARKRSSRGPGRGSKTSVWRRYYAARNLIVVMRRFGRPGSALVVTAVQVLSRPLADLVRRRSPMLRYSGAGVRGAVDAWRGRLGRVVEPVGP